MLKIIHKPPDHLLRLLDNLDIRSHKKSYSPQIFSFILAFGFDLGVCVFTQYS